jgi:hypothetical protein
MIYAMVISIRMNASSIFIFPTGPVKESDVIHANAWAEGEMLAMQELRMLEEVHT